MNGGMIGWNGRVVLLDWAGWTRLEWNRGAWCTRDELVCGGWDEHECIFSVFECCVAYSVRSCGAIYLALASVSCLLYS
jgi:hypothetical protein